MKGDFLDLEASARGGMGPKYVSGKAASVDQRQMHARTRQWTHVALAIFVGIDVGLSAYFRYLRRRSKQKSWADLVATLNWTDGQHIAKVALEMVDESGERRSAGHADTLENSGLWELLGGMDGLAVIERNSLVLIDIASFVQQSHPETLVIAERLRQDARELNWHLTRLRGAALTGNLQVSFPFYARRAVVAYYRMTRRLLSLHEAGNLPTLADLWPPL